MKPIRFRLSLSKKFKSGWESNDSDIFLTEIIKQGYSYTASKDAVYLPLYY